MYRHTEFSSSYHANKIARSKTVAFLMSDVLLQYAVFVNAGLSLGLVRGHAFPHECWKCKFALNSRENRLLAYDMKSINMKVVIRRRVGNPSLVSIR